MSNNDAHIKKQLDKYNDTRSNRKKLSLERTATKRDSEMCNKVDCDRVYHDLYLHTGQVEDLLVALETARRNVSEFTGRTYQQLIDDISEDTGVKMPDLA